MNQRRSALGAQEPQSAEAPVPPFGHLMGFWRGTPPAIPIAALHLPRELEMPSRLTDAPRCRAAMGTSAVLKKALTEKKNLL